MKIFDILIYHIFCNWLQILSILQIDISFTNKIMLLYSFWINEFMFFELSLEIDFATKLNFIKKNFYANIIIYLLFYFILNNNLKEIYYFHNIYVIILMCKIYKWKNIEKNK